jgi:cation diffusion facilitator CzcD-associated flavoprotein CzcO
MSDFPQKFANGYYANGQEVQNYLESYADINNLNKHVHLNTSVETVERKTDGKKKDGLFL